MDDIISIKISFERRSDLARLLGITLLAVFMLAGLAWQAFAAPATESPSAASPMAYWPRRYYLTPSYYNGAQADGSDGDGAGVCAPGFHFASLWEMQDTSNLRYERNLGITQADSGAGPPTWFTGWVRTGHFANALSTTPGVGNCNIWTSNSSDHYGTAIWLDKDWSGGINPIPWTAGSLVCAGPMPVWCIADQAGFQVYMPLVLNP